MSPMAAYDSLVETKAAQGGNGESLTGPPISRPNIRPLALIVLWGCDCRSRRSEGAPRCWLPTPSTLVNNGYHCCWRSSKNPHIGG
ncbi:hypothetical protein Zmor_014839 [Zophobas morio]|uniref:Uncharacterized protein n=1 Tax=Zophobas morio TaxID=2755281 RepID=A0AA38MHD8_9CUCU|nr:hypothetical protein Zmor_014839 [Zophobas morio]